MAITYENKESIKESILKKTYHLTCTNPRCFLTWTLDGSQFDRIIKEEGEKGLKCPKCGSQCI